MPNYPAAGPPVVPARAGRGTCGGASAVIEEPVQDPDSETQCLDRNTLVDAVEHGGEVQLGGEPQRGEAEAPDAEPAERLGVSAAGQAVRHDPGIAVLGQQRRCHGRAEIAVERRLQRAAVEDELAPDAGPEQPVDLGEELSSWPGRKRPSTSADAC